jgi:hypothetical protein
MAERDVTPAAVPPPARSIGGWLVLATLLALTLLVALRNADRRLDASESAAVLAAASLVGDGDVGWRDSDRARLAALGSASRPALRSAGGAGNRIDASVLLAAWLAPWTTASLRIGSTLGVWLALAVAAVALALGLRGRLGSNAPWWSAAAIWGTGAFASAFRLDDGTLVLALITVALALILAEGNGETTELGEIYRGHEAPGAIRSVTAGLLIALAAASRPWLFGLVLVLPFLLAHRGVARRPRILAAGLALGIAAGVGFASGNLAALLDTPGLVPAVALRNLLTLLAGPRFGLVWIALPIVVIAVVGIERGLRSLLAVPLVAGLWLLVVMPFSWSAAPATLVGPWPLALAALWWVVPGTLPRRLLIGVLVLGHLSVAGFWGSPLAGWHDRLATPLARWLPWETTQPAMPGETEIVSGDLLIRSLDPHLTPTATGALMAAAGRSRLLVASPVALERLRLDMSADAPSTLPLRGATAGDTMFRPDGGVTLFADVRDPIAVHPNAAGETTWWYSLELDAGSGGFTLELTAP